MMARSSSIILQSSMEIEQRTCERTKFDVFHFVYFFVCLFIFCLSVTLLHLWSTCSLRPRWHHGSVRNFKPLIFRFSAHVLLCPCPVGKGHYKMGRVVCPSARPSVCLSVPCLDLTREWKGPGSPKLAGWKSITRGTREPI